jgi:hypothetical protein
MEKVIEGQVKLGDIKMIDEGVVVEAQLEEEDGDMGVTIYSCDLEGDHTEFNSLVGKQVRVTIEVID